jgi:carbon-monoxide dehydrogenase large subunit
VPPRYSLTRGRVRYVRRADRADRCRIGRAIAQDAAEAVAIEYNERPVVITAEAALRAGRAAIARLDAGQPGPGFVGGDEAATNAAFAKAAKVVKLAAYPTRVVGTRWSLAPPTGKVRSGDRRLRSLDARRKAPARCASSWSDARRAAGKVRIIAEEVGGGFGVRSQRIPRYGALSARERKSWAAR